MGKYKVLIIDDDQQICKILKDYFQFENFKAIVAYTGEAGLKKLKNIKPDLIILDIMLPEINGWQVCKKVRAQSEVPIIMLSAKNKDVDRINGLELGADDYVTKPFSPKEVVLRAKTILRRLKKNEDKNTLNYPNLTINKLQRKVKVADKEITLSPKEFDLLWKLASAPKQVFPRDNLLKTVWGYNYFGDERTVDTHINYLRNKLGEHVASYIKTVWGLGYKFEIE